MFLNSLNLEEKENFLSLVYQVANVDGSYGEEESEIIKNYMSEVGLQEIKEDKSIQQIIEYFSLKETHLQKVIYFEVYGLIISDDKLDKNESSVLSAMEDKFSISADTVQALKAVVEKLRKVYDDIYDILL